jgi:hypothetical protein
VVVLGGLGIRQRGHLTTSHGDRGARIEGGLRGRFVERKGLWTMIKEEASKQEAAERSASARSSKWPWR